MDDKDLLTIETEFEDSNLDRIVPTESDFTAKTETYLPLSDVYKTYTYNQELFDRILTRPKASIGEKIGAGLKRTGDMVSDLGPQMREFVRRSVNGHTLPNMTEEQATAELEAGTRSLLADRQARAIIEQYEGTDDSIITNTIGAAGSAGVLLATGVVGGLTGGVPGASYAVGLTSAAMATGEASQDYAEKYYLDNYGMRGYKGSKDSIYAAAYGAISGFIESKLGVDNLLKATFAKTGIKQLKRGLAKNALESALGEGAEEILQEGSSALFGTLAGAEDRTGGEFIHDALTNAAYGAAIGGVFGSSVYYANRAKLQKYFKRYGYSDEEAKSLAMTALDDTKDAMMKEIATSTSLRDSVGAPFDALVGKIENALNAAGWQETQGGLSVHDYAVVNASDMAWQVLRQANASKLPVSDILDLSQIEVVDNAIWLKPQNFGTAQDIRAQINALDSQIKDINTQLKTQRERAKQLTEDKELTARLRAEKKEHQRRKDLLQRLYDSKTGIDQEQQARRNLQKQRYMLTNYPNADQNSFDSRVRTQARNDIKALRTDQQALNGDQLRQKNAAIALIAGNDTALLDSLILDNTPNVQRGLNTAVESLPALMADKKLAAEYRQAMKLAMQAHTQAEFESAIDGATFGASAILHEIVYKGDATPFIQSYEEKKQANIDGNNKLGAQGVFTDNDLYYQALKEQNPDAFDGDSCTNKALTAVLMTRNAPYTTGLAPLFQDQLDLAAENARLDAENEPYTGDTININGVEKTVYNSNGDRIAKSEAALRNFYRWFGDSKVVDEQGRPLVVYHGSPNEFDIFDNTVDTEKVRQMGAENGYFFTDKEKVARRFIPKRARQVADTTNEKIEKFGSVEKFEDFGKKIMEDAWALRKELGDDTFQDLRTAYFDIKNTESGVDYSYDPQAYGLYKVYLKAENVNEFSGEELGVGTERDFALRSAKANDNDGVIIYKADTGAGIANEYIVFESNQIKSTDNRGTYSLDAPNIYHQRDRETGYYDAELKVIVLGRNMNTTTLPHEMAHFWLDNMFSMYKQAQRGDITPDEEWIDQTNSLFKILGVDYEQASLTRSQQETFATMTEAVITGLAPVPDGATLPITEYLNWVPEKYKSIRQIGFRNENGLIVHPVLDKAAVDFFNIWYGNITLPTLPSSPARDSFTNPRDKNGNIIPSTVDTMKGRAETMDKAIKDQESADKADIDARTARLSSATQAEMAASQAQYDNITSDKPQLPRHESWIKIGRRTNTVQQLADAARAYVKKNPDHAREIAQADPLHTENDTGVDRESLILAVMEYDNVSFNSDDGRLYEHNIALSRSRAGTELGTHSKSGSYQTYLDALAHLKAAMTERAAYKYAGRSADAVAKFNNDIDVLVAKWADKVFKEGMGKTTALKSLLAEAEVKFTGENTGKFNQLDLTKTGKSRQIFIAYANKLIKENITRAEPAAELQSKLLYMAPKAEKAATDLNSPDAQTAADAAKTLRDWAEIVRSEDASQSLLGKAINIWAPRAMLSGISTHTVGIVSNVGEQTMLRSAIAAHYGKNIIPQEMIDAEKARIKTVYNETGMNLTTMIGSSDPSLVHGEKYKPLDPKSKYKWVDPMQYLSLEDNLVRIPTYVDVIARMASRDSGGDINKAKELFRQYASTQAKKVDGEPNPLYAKRAEAVMVAGMATFTHNGKFAGILNKMRDALNSLSIEGRSVQLGTMIAPFVKTPANIIEMGLRSPYGAVKTLYKALAGKEITIENAVDTAHFIGLAFIGTAAALLCNYEPPYERGKYDPNKPYDSIEIAPGAWVKIDALGVLEAPLRILLTARDKKLGAGLKATWVATPLLGELSDGGLDYAVKDPAGYAMGVGYNQLGKLTPTLARQIAKPIIRETGTTIDADSRIGRKFAGRWGLDASENTINDYIGLITNRIKFSE